MSLHFNHALINLRDNLLTLMECTEKTVDMSVIAIKNNDFKLAKEVISGDDKIDQMEVEIEEECLKILALYQPVASDLRFIITVLKVINDLERIGDLAVNISQCALFLSKIKRDEEALFDFDIMSKKTAIMLKDAINSLVDQDVEKAIAVCKKDEEIDEINREMYKLVHASIINSPGQVDYYLQYLSVSRQLERIADYATNIAEDVIYMVDGKIVRHAPEIHE